MSVPLVSVVTPSYNQAAYLEYTLRSVLGQDYPRVEYIVVDGGSTDGSVDLLRRYADRLAWWVSEPDAGQADALRKGFARARGEILAWLNSDDMYAPGAIAAAVRALLQHPDAGWVVGDALSVDATGRPFHHHRGGPWGLAELMTLHILPQPAVFFRRTWYARVGGVDPSFRYLMDHHLWLRLARAAGPPVYVPQVWAFARYHPQAKNLAQAAGFGAEALRLARWLSQDPAYAAEYASRRRAVWAAAYRFSARYLLDGGHPWRALAHYLRAWAWHPRVAAREAHRALYALLAGLGLSDVGRWYLRRKRAAVPAVAARHGWFNVHTWVDAVAAPPPATERAAANRARRPAPDRSAPPATEGQP